MRNAPISYADAKKNPALRQAYLDSRAGLRNECMADIIYDPDGGKTMDECRKTRSPCDKKKVSSTEMVGAGVLITKKMFGKGLKKNVYVYPGAFTFDEETFASVIRQHEGTHACDAFYGIRAGGEIFGSKRLAFVHPSVLNAVLEVRASGTVLKGASPEQWDRPVTAFQIPVFHQHFVNLIYYLKHKGGANAQLIRKTLKEYGAVVEIINGKVIDAMEAEKGRK